MTSRPLGRAQTILLAVIVAVSAVASFRGIDRAAIWLDEGVTLGIVRMGLADYLRHAWDPLLNNQLAYYLAVRPWHLLGESETAIRSFSWIASVGTIVIVFLLGRRLFGTGAGLVAAAALGLHAATVTYAQEARAYAFATLLVSAAALFLARAVESGRRGDVGAWVALAVLASYAHFFATLAVAAQVLSLAALGYGRLRQRSGLLLGVVFLAAGVAPIFIYGAGAPVQFLQLPSADAPRVLAVASYLAGGRTFLLTFLAVLMVALGSRAAVERRPERRWSAVLVLLWALFPLLALTVASRVWHPFLADRYVIMSVPAWSLSLAAVAGPLTSRRRLAPIGLALTAFVLLGEFDALSAVYGRWYEDWRAPASHVARATLPGDVVIHESPWTGLALGYYLDREARRPEPLQQGPLAFDGSFDESRAAAAERVWFAVSRPDPGHFGHVDALLRRTHPVVHSASYGFITVLLYDRSIREPGKGSFGRRSP